MCSINRSRRVKAIRSLLAKRPSWFEIILHLDFRLIANDCQIGMVIIIEISKLDINNNAVAFKNVTRPTVFTKQLQRVAEFLERGDVAVQPAILLTRVTPKAQSTS